MRYRSAIAWAWVVLANVANGAGVDSTTTKEALSKYYSVGNFGPTLDRSNGGTSLEICFDVCYYYRGARVENENDLWDLAFLHQYYFDDRIDLDDFRYRYASVARRTLKQHENECLAVAKTRLPQCIVRGLASRNVVSYFFVRYDVGYRCQMAANFINREVLGKAVCRRVR
jgi:hypothetical protein